MKETFGEYVETENVFEYLVISFDPSKMSLQQRWKGNSISANFLAAYWGTFGPAFNPKLAHTQTKDTISWIANELIENAVKFSDNDNFYPIKIFLNLAAETLDFYVENSVTDHAKEELKQRISQIQNNDVTQLYFDQIEKNAEIDDGESKLGLLIMKMDLRAEIAWKFEKRESPMRHGVEVNTVTTMVRLPIEKDQE